MKKDVCVFCGTERFQQQTTESARFIVSLTLNKLTSTKLVLSTMV